jgi:hypothetical protein
MYVYQLQLSIAQPSDLAPANFSKRKNEVLAAAKKFNDQFKGQKSIEIKELNENILLHLLTAQPLSNPIKELTLFSQILRHEYQWFRYSMVEYRLFNILLLEETVQEDEPMAVEERVQDKKSGNDVHINLRDESGNIEYILSLKDTAQLKAITEHLALLLELSEAKLSLLYGKSLLKKRESR